MPVLTVFFFQVTYIKAKHHSKQKLWCYDIVSNPRPISSSLVVLDKRSRPIRNTVYDMQRKIKTIYRIWPTRRAVLSDGDDRRIASFRWRSFPESSGSTLLNILRNSYPSYKLLNAYIGHNYKYNKSYPICKLNGFLNSFRITLTQILVTGAGFEPAQALSVPGL